MHLKPFPEVGIYCKVIRGYSDILHWQSDVVTKKKIDMRNGGTQWTGFDTSRENL